MEVFRESINIQELLLAIYGITHSRLFFLLITSIVIDILTGKTKALKSGTIDSAIGTTGIIKHTTIIILVFVVGVWCRVLGVVEGSFIFSLFILLEYVTSIIENLDVIGIRVPTQFRKYFNRLHDEIDNGKDDI